MDSVVEADAPSVTELDPVAAFDRVEAPQDGLADDRMGAGALGSEDQALPPRGESFVEEVVFGSSTAKEGHWRPGPGLRELDESGGRDCNDSNDTTRHCFVFVLRGGTSVLWGKKGGAVEGPVGREEAEADPGGLEGHDAAVRRDEGDSREETRRFRLNHESEGGDEAFDDQGEAREEYKDAIPSLDDCAVPKSKGVRAGPRKFLIINYYFAAT